MPIPAANRGGGGVVTPLTSRYNQNSLPEPANALPPTKQAWFNGGDIQTIVIKPTLAKSGIPDPVIPKPSEIDVRKFFPGGVS